jgi:Flp pilus assembly pilin Flp
MRHARFLSESAGLATVEYIVGAAVIIGTLVIGITSWNNGLVARLEALVTQMQAVR